MKVPLALAARLEARQEEIKSCKHPLKVGGRVLSSPERSIAAFFIQTNWPLRPSRNPGASRTPGLYEPLDFRAPLGPSRSSSTPWALLDLWIPWTL